MKHANRATKPSIHGVAHRQSPISNREIPRLDMPLSHWKHTKPNRSNREIIRPIMNRYVASAVPALALRPGLASMYIEASATRVLDCGFLAWKARLCRARTGAGVIAFPPGGGAVTLIQTQRAKSQLDRARRELPARTIALLRRSATISANFLQPEVIDEIL